jgi:hypothetical protein
MPPVGISVLIRPSLRDWIAEDHLVWTACAGQKGQAVLTGRHDIVDQTPQVRDAPGRAGCV